MRVRIMTMRYSATLGGFDDGPLADFIRDKELLSFREHFYLVNDVPHLTCVLGLQDSVVAAEVLAEARQQKPGRNGREKTDPAEGLGEADRVLFNSLRSWRNETARAEGVPAYVVLTNKELVAIVQTKPESPTALCNVPGIGKKKVERHGKLILETLHGKEAVS